MWKIQNKKTFCKDLHSNWSKHIGPLTYVISDLNGEKIVGTLYKEESRNKPNKIQG